MKINLGQLFLLRRDLKQEINNLSSEVAPLIAYREDKESTKQEYEELIVELANKRSKLHVYDMIIETSNSENNTVNFKEIGYSLNNARHYKVQLLAEVGFYENLVRQAASYSKRVERELEYKIIENVPGQPQQVPIQVERKYALSANLKDLKNKVSNLKRDVQLLDSAIQAADWSSEVEIPE